MENRRITIPTPFGSTRGSVLPEWIDYNGHMNIAYYVLAFDQGTDDTFEYFKIGRDYCDSTKNSLFTLELHVNYFNEILEGEHFQINSYLLDVSPKRINLFHEMHCAESGKLIATNENMLVHIDMDTRRSAPFPPNTLSWLEEIARAHASVPRPEQAGRSIKI